MSTIHKRNAFWIILKTPSNQMFPYTGGCGLYFEEDPKDRDPKAKNDLFNKRHYYTRNGKTFEVSPMIRWMLNG
jgi:hypothetical protein